MKNLHLKKEAFIEARKRLDKGEFVSPKDLHDINEKQLAYNELIKIAEFTGELSKHLPRTLLATPNVNISLNEVLKKTAGDIRKYTAIIYNKKLKKGE